MRCCGVLGALLLVNAASAADVPAGLANATPLPGDCVIFREGGVGRVIRTPTYWLKGTVADTTRERRLAGRCPIIGKSVPAYTRADWLRVAAATPCVESDTEVREVAVLRILVAVDSWETPWSNQHGTAAWLFRGQFLDRPLKPGELIDMDSTWLEHCSP